MGTFETYLEKIGKSILNPVIALLFGLALVYFLWGVFEFVRNADSDTAREQGKLHMLWGIVGMAIMVSAYGIIKVILGTIGVESPLPLP